MRTVWLWLYCIKHNFKEKISYAIASSHKTWPLSEKINIKKKKNTDSRGPNVGRLRVSLIKWAMKMLSCIVRVTTCENMYYLIATRDNNYYYISPVLYTNAEPAAAAEKIQCDLSKLNGTENWSSREWTAGRTKDEIQLSLKYSAFILLLFHCRSVKKTCWICYISDVVDLFLPW